jgi:serine/threonine protein kinase/Tfp pilus assembly protein PilF
MDEKEAPGKTMTSSPEKTVTLRSDQTADLPSTSVAARIIGPYHLLQKLGEGGMGEVWAAEQYKPIRRKVAVKLIRSGMDTKQFIARFESERQALAMMDHPAIAKVFDAGETEEGLPYFVMEYVQGIPITTYCDRQRLTTQERLELFLQVCEGVQHAHQKAIIHRDLKPSNILVTDLDGKPVPKIIDFGVAKATAQSLTEKTMYTEMGVLIGTPEYMSPEQAEMTGQNIDTRTDVYSLGNILYELLTGALPFDPKELRKAGFNEICRKIREEDPPKPSTRLSSMGEASIVSAENQRTEPPTLLRNIRGDLDWITMKALEKDPARRYGTPSEFTADIVRFLHHQPIVARQPSKSYRAKKFVRRHRVGVGAALLSAILLSAFSIMTAFQARRIARERDRANQEAMISSQVATFLSELFKVADPSEARGNSITVREMLNKGAEKIDQAFLEDKPLIQGVLLDRMGVFYMNLGLYAPAQVLLERSLETRAKTLGPDHPEVAVGLIDLAELYRIQGKYEQAERLLNRSLTIREKAFGRDDTQVAIALNNLAALARAQGKYVQAEPLYLRSLAITEKAVGTVHQRVATILDNLAVLYGDQGKYALAEVVYKRSLAIREELLRPDHPDVARSLNNLADLYLHQGKHAQSEPLFKRSLAIMEKAFGPDHPNVAVALDNLASVYGEQAQYALAEPLYKRSLAIREKALRPDNPTLAWSLNNLATLYRAQGQYALAEPLFKRSLAIGEKAFSPEHPIVASMLNNLADLYIAQGQYAQAEPLLKRALAIREKALRPDQPDLAMVLHNLGRLYIAQGQYALAKPLFKRSLAIKEKALGPDHPSVAWSLSYIATIYRKEGQYAQAEPLYKRSLAITEKAFGPNHPDIAVDLENLAKLYRATNRGKEAEELEQRAERIRAIKR